MRGHACLPAVRMGEGCTSCSHLKGAPKMASPDPRKWAPQHMLFMLRDRPRPAQQVLPKGTWSKCSPSIKL